MGVTWCADVISWAVGGPHYIWYLTDLINALQGVFIFVVVGCQPQVNGFIIKIVTIYHPIGVGSEFSRTVFVKLKPTVSDR